ncbi:hypothetical protein [Lentibacillus sp. CBA3610]|uniref:hypothetical protein n=1 Tax=Lentibacillus sp. CBA3610 TaxID=2518176 RepID=UPI00159616DF|nr:hypothetical protein [Lentibacillus sp. CBA3610]QKY70023.1 hypothetical protein Len3610_10850 [Lentibacillus sp. CBA3610]
MRKIVLVTIAVILFSVIVLCFRQSPEEQAVEAVETFYTYEQNADFSDSWEMFHPYMKEKFDKLHYLTDRPHVFMNHFDVTTFDFSLGETVEIKEWKPSKDAEAIDVVYKVMVEMHYKGKYGNFTLIQPVFATELEGEWKVLWDYKE